MHWWICWNCYSPTSPNASLNKRRICFGLNLPHSWILFRIQATESDRHQTSFFASPLITGNILCREVLVTDKFIYSFFKRVSIVTAPPPHPSIVTATPSSTPLENASSLVCHCKNWELQKAGLLPIPCVSLITGTGDKRCAAPEYNASVSWFKHPFQGLTLHHLWGGGGASEKGWIAYPPPPPKKKEEAGFRVELRL